MKLLDVFHGKYVNLVFEFCEFDLEKVIQASSIILTEARVKSYLQMTLRGIQACHDAWVLHRDLKPSNLLIDTNGVLKVGDFGLARLYASPERAMTATVVTLWYRAPELLFGSKHYGTGVDIWSIGLIFAELMIRTPLLPGQSEIDQLGKTFHLFGTPTQDDWPNVLDLPSYMEFSPKEAVSLDGLFPAASKQARDLLRAMLKLNPNKRPTTEEALAHAYFSQGEPPAHPSDLPKIR